MGSGQNEIFPSLATEDLHNLVANDTHVLEENEDMMQDSKENGIFWIVFMRA